MLCKYNIDNKKVYKFLLPIIESNMYIILSGDSALMIDPGENIEAEKLLRNNKVKHLDIILTHEHYDHISGVNYYKERFKCTVYGSEKCKELVVNPSSNLSAYFMAIFIDRDDETIKQAKKIFRDNFFCSVDRSFVGSMKIQLNDMSISMIETPGHSMGSICILINDRYIFSGDSIIPGEKVILRLPGSDRNLWKTISKPFLDGLKDDLIVFPGHGAEGLLGDMR